MPPTTSQPRFYEIQSGDTLIEIAATFGLPVQAIMEANGIADPNASTPARSLELPLASEIVVTSLAAGHDDRRRPRQVPAVTTIAP